MAFDPMQMMMLMSGVQGFADNLGAAQRGEPVQQSGGMREFVPMMAMMQRGQAQSQELELQRQQFAAEQQALQQQMQEDAAAAKHLNVPVEVLRLARQKMGEEYAERLGAQTVGANDRLYFGGQQVVDALPEYHDGVLVRRSDGAATPVQAAQDFMLKRAVLGRPDQRTSVYLPPDETEMGKGIGKAASDRWVGVYDQEANAKNILDKWNAIEGLTKNIPTGQGFDSWRTETMKLLSSAGFNVNEAELADRQAVDKLVSKLAFEAMNNKATDAGANPTDRDLLQMLMQQPGMETTNEARKLMVDLQTAEYDWARGKREALERMRKETGRRLLPEEVFEFESSYAASVPKYGKVAEKWGDRAAKSQPGPTPPPGSVGGVEPPPVPRGGGLSISPDVEARMRAKGY